MSFPSSREKYYSGIRSPLKDRLVQFLESHPLQRIDASGERWTYFAGGSGKETLVLLPGGLGIAEPWFDCMLDWERQFRVVAISYPLVTSASSAVQAIATVLERESAGRSYLLGTSLGGEIAQAFLRQRPGQLSRVVLGNTGEANADYGKKLKRQMPLMKLFTTRFAFALLKVAARNRVLKLLKPYLSNDDLEFWTAYMTDVIDNEYSPDLMRSQFNVLQDFATHYTGAIKIPPATEMLIVEAEDDIMFSQERREKLKSIFPAARVKTYTGGGHLLAITKRSEYVADITKFLTAQ
jgi:pimeloyl-ACP methyl ester carboxylesterase